MKVQERFHFVWVEDTARDFSCQTKSMTKKSLISGIQLIDSAIKMIQISFENKLW